MWAKRTLNWAGGRGALGPKPHNFFFQHLGPISLRAVPLYQLIEALYAIFRNTVSDNNHSFEFITDIIMYTTKSF